jgi:hypothetical protein
LYTKQRIDIWRKLTPFGFWTYELAYILERHSWKLDSHAFKESKPRTTDTHWRHKSKMSEKLGRCGRQNMLRPYLQIWDWDWIFGRAVKPISSLDIRSPWSKQNKLDSKAPFCDQTWVPKQLRKNLKMFRSHYRHQNMVHYFMNLNKVLWNILYYKYSNLLYGFDDYISKDYMHYCWKETKYSKERCSL